jgi:superfamily II DNA or RNA helicase
MEDDDKKEVVRQYMNGDLQVLWNVALMKEGVDIPEMECMILAKPCKSITTWLQMAGRILRHYPGKQKGLILAWDLGYPTDPLPLFLHDGTREATERQKKQKEKKEQSEVLCPMCKKIKKSLKCEGCGFEVKIKPNVDVAPGKLAKMTRSQELSGNSEQLYGELKQLGIERKWKENKAKVHFKNITGEWPNGMDHVKPVPATDKVKKMVQHLNIKGAKGGWKRG